MSIVNFEQLNEILESSWIKTKEKIKEMDKEGELRVGW